MTKENPITILQQKYDAQEIAEIVQVTLEEMKTIGFVTFYFKISNLIKPYLFWSSLIQTLFIMFGNAELWTFFIPAIPVLILFVLFGVDFLFIQFSLLRAHRRLQKYIEKKIDWDDMVYASVIAFAIREPFDDESDEPTAPY
jgi:hypothetical protein